MEGLTPLRRRGRHQNDVAARPTGNLWLREHLRHTGLHHPKYAVEVDPERAAPLLHRHRRNRLVVRRPDAVVHHQVVDPAKCGGCGGDQRLTILHDCQFLLDCPAKLLAAALGYQLLGLRRSRPVAEHYPRPSLPKHLHRSRANSPRPARHQRYLTCQR